MLEAGDAKIVSDRNSRKEPLTDAEAKKLIASVNKVLVAKGKKLRELAPGDTVLDDLKGPTGNYRAPIVRKGKTLLVGFHPETLESLV